MHGWGGVAASPCQLKQLSRAGLLAPSILERLHLWYISGSAALQGGSRYQLMQAASHMPCILYRQIRSGLLAISGAAVLRASAGPGNVSIKRWDKSGGACIVDDAPPDWVAGFAPCAVRSW